MSTADTDPMVIRMLIEVEHDAAVDKLKAFKNEIDMMPQVLGKTRLEWQAVNYEIRAATIGWDTMISPVRSVSWDLMLMGRGLSMMNSHLLGNNKLMAEYIGIIYSFASILRIAVAAVDIYKGAIMALTVINSLFSASETAAATAIGVRTTATTAALIPTAALAVLTGGASIGFGAGAASLTALIPFQHGGTIPATGPYLMHKGETVIPSGGTNFSNITINMQTGPISSSLDVDRMLDIMALRMAQESRRRIGS